MKINLRTAAWLFCSAILAKLEAADVLVPEMVHIPAGKFTMGSPDSEIGRQSNEGPQTQVTISKDFFIGKYEVTQAEYRSVMGENPSWFHGIRSTSLQTCGFCSTNIDYGTGSNRPVDNVSWQDAATYCHLLTQTEKEAGRLLDGWEYRLPTEAEWEYACRAGTTTAFHYGTGLYSGMANFIGYLEYDSSIGGITLDTSQGIYLEQTSPVGSYQPNAWGLYDMHGNVSEWTMDFLGDTLPGGNAADPVGTDVKIGTTDTIERLTRGGSWQFGAWACRSATRYNFATYAGTGWNDTGFRVVLAPPDNYWLSGIEKIPEQPAYGVCPTKLPGKDSLIVVTHGAIPTWETTAEESTAWIDNMINIIQRYLDSHNLSNWQVAAYRWVDDAEATKEDILLDGVLVRAEGDGGYLGVHLAAQRWNSVHLIAHSAGSALIQAATEIIAEIAPNTSVHETFLDPYLGTTYEGKRIYGSNANWSDTYFCFDLDTKENIINLTSGSLDHSYSVDTTFIDPNGKKSQGYASVPNGLSGTILCARTVSSHDWPIKFYSNTVTGMITSEYRGFGFPLSKEGGNWDFAIGNYHVGNDPPLVLGTADPTCLPDPQPDFPIWEQRQDLGKLTVIGNPTDGFSINGFGLIMTPHSPVWAAFIMNVTNQVNTVSFDAGFSSVSNSQELLSVVWDTNIIGSVDERVVLPGLRRYSFMFPKAAGNGAHILGFRVDSYTNVSSVFTLTNVALGFVNVPEAFFLSFSGTYTDGHPVFQLNGPSGYTYRLEASTDLSDWTTVAVLANTNGIVPFVDPETTNSPQRFFRAAVP